MALIFDCVGQATATTGTGTLTLGSVITDATNGDFATFADMGAVAGNVVGYRITDGNNWELGIGTLGGTGPGFTLTRTVGKSKISGTVGTTALTLSGTAKVFSMFSLAGGSPKLAPSGLLTLASTTGGSAYNDPEILIGNGGHIGITGYGNNFILLYDGLVLCGFGPSGVTFRSSAQIVWSSGSDPTAGGDTSITRTAAGVLEVNDTNTGTYKKLIVGGLAVGVTANKTSAYTATANDNVIPCDASGGAFTFTLPTAVGIKGQKYAIKKVDSSANAITVATTSSQTIDGSTTSSLASQWSVLRVVSNGANWLVI